jgi:transcriptional regulator of acetoin/glycerol metabolism
MADSFQSHADQVFTVARGHALPGGSEADPSIARSWLRCLEQHHLDPAARQAPLVLEQARMRECRERARQVLEIASGEMNSLHRQLAGRGHAVLLTDAQGVILNRVTDDAERLGFERAGLWLGADWSESAEGTNGIGTCVVERQPLTIHQHEHFRSRHTVLTCSASPVFDPYGALLAVLDVSSVRADVSRQSQFHTMALVNLSAKLIEGCYFLRHFEQGWLLRFQTQPEYVGLFSEGLLAFDDQGRIQALNQSALNLLGTDRERLLGQRVEEVFELPFEALCALSDGQLPHARSAPWPLRLHDGRLLYALLRGPKPVGPAAPPRARPAPRVPGLCLGDARLGREFGRALKVYERDVPLLLHGETGSGKEAFASAVHRAASRAGRPFVALNCAAIPESLIESELFGYRGGSFTGARKEGMAGKLAQANGGTLFLDEIGDMPLAMQTRLLRVLEAREVVPLGGGAAQPLDIRLISASHRDLSARVGEGAFREDLFYRLSGLAVTLPPLREREDKAALIDQLLAEEAGDRPLRLGEEARARLLAYPWPGNVRQLRTVLRTLAALCEDEAIGVDDLPEEIRRAAVAPATTPAPLDAAERQALLAALDQQRWHMTRAAAHLGISRNTLYRKLRQHGIRRRAE